MLVTQMPVRRRRTHAGILGADGRPIRARYDAAVTTEENRRHWANADALSADAAMSASVRATVRRRARYEIANNSYARGIVETLANDTVGPGPTLKVTIPGRKELSEQIEWLWWEWTEAVRLAERLRTLRKARVGDGEGFVVLMSNPGLESPVQLDPVLVEADRVSSPNIPMSGGGRDVDGIVFDTWDNPVAYLVCPHPGAAEAAQLGQVPVRVPAALVMHWFRCDRPGQHRGISELMPALSLFAQLRRFTLAVLTAAETAADFAGFLYTKAAPDALDEGAVAPEAFSSMELTRGMFVALPDGYEPGQMKPEEPATTYADFKREIINEIARCLNMPFNVAAGNSSAYNYASGRLDHQVYFKSIQVDRSDMERVVLTPLFREWLREALSANGIPELRGEAALVRRWWRRHRWDWPGREHVDPLKEASAADTLKKAGLLTDDDYLRQRGTDVVAHYEQLSLERKLRLRLGLPEPQGTADPGRPADPADDETREERRRQREEDGDDPDEEEDEEE